MGGLELGLVLIMRNLFNDYINNEFIKSVIKL
jgi:hypothetical protein